MAESPKDEYLRHASECVRFALTVRDAKLREIFEAMAKTWIKMAADFNRTRKGQA